MQRLKYVAKLTAVGEEKLFKGIFRLEMQHGTSTAQMVRNYLIKSWMQVASKSLSLLFLGVFCSAVMMMGIRGFIIERSYLRTYLLYAKYKEFLLISIGAVVA